MIDEKFVKNLKSKVKKESKKTGQSFNQLWHQLVLQRFLEKVSHSKHKKKFIFKGGMLLSHYLPLNRETVDLDFLLKSIKGERGVFRQILLEIVETKSSDNDFTFEIQKLELVDHAATDYFGFRVSMTAILGRMKTAFSIDAAFGDVVDDEIREIGLLDFSDNKKLISLHVYPPEFIFSEKLETVISKGAANTRMKDFYDLWILIEQKKLDRKKLQGSLRKTFTHRNTAYNLEIKFPPNVIDRMNDYWDNFLQKKLKSNLKKKFEDTIFEINKFLKGIEDE